MNLKWFHEWLHKHWLLALLISVTAIALLIIYFVIVPYPPYP